MCLSSCFDVDQVITSLTPQRRYGDMQPDYCESVHTRRPLGPQSLHHVPPAQLQHPTLFCDSWFSAAISISAVDIANMDFITVHAIRRQLDHEHTCTLELVSREGFVKM